MLCGYNRDFNLLYGNLCRLSDLNCFACMFLSCVLGQDTSISESLSPPRAQVVRKVNNAIRLINRYPIDSGVCFVNTDTLDSA